MNQKALKVNKKNIMCVYEKYNKKGELSYELHCSGKNALTKQYKVFIKTYKVPKEITTEREKDKFCLQCQIEWQDEVRKKSKGLLAFEGGKTCFYDYASKWVEDIIRYNKEAYNYYSRCKSNLPIFKEKFGLLTLEEMTLPVVQNFCDWICERTYKKETVTVKRDLHEVTNARHLSFRQTYETCGITNAVLCNVYHVGKTISRETAEKVSKGLNIRLETYFEVTSKDVPYSKSANKNLKVMLHSVLARAVKERLIPINYASSEYTKPVCGTKGVKEIFATKEEIHEFISKVNQEVDIRKRVAFMLGINLGLRGAETTGLSWEDINFDEGLISINKNTMYVDGFGIITKSPKNASSRRTITMPSNLIALLKEYKEWWNVQKENHGDLWEYTDKLFVQNCGKDMSNSTICIWLKDFELRNNLKRVTYHGLRHTNITMLITNGVDIKTVSARVGHSDIQTTLNIYSHYSKDGDKKASHVIEELLCTVA